MGTVPSFDNATESTYVVPILSGARSSRSRGVGNVGNAGRLALSTLSTWGSGFGLAFDTGSIEVQVRESLLFVLKVLGQGEVDVLGRARFRTRQLEDIVDVIVDLRA